VDEGVRYYAVDPATGVTVVFTRHGDAVRVDGYFDPQGRPELVWIGGDWLFGVVAANWLA